ncbi:interferon-induced very large GTPase 1-like [Dendronephthya gigantea]|uniref:interferon-induced very large GTPase 1-like n=1 Tax=Dendronephthya gigantea TaxID=151771 RepID=UPI00106CD98A|nr:interferon-induced very large GTPase 1-like [Dendronephthya gigantea]XP_028403248.1 interferon-induced very large GTPase 1-like [Dendronephthya gigantea]
MLNLQGGVSVRPNSKYSLKQARSVDKYTLNDDQLTHPNAIPKYIFNKLMITDYRVREFELNNKARNTYDSDESEDEDDEREDEGDESEDEGDESEDEDDESEDEDDEMEDDDIGEETGVHPMDAFLRIFHSSDIFLRRYLATRLSECQLSVPFLLPDPKTGKSENVTMLLSALQNITKSWKSGSSNNESVQEVFATLHPFPVVSFIRLGQPTMSKSFLINKIMSDGGSNHNFFFHKDMEGGDVERKVVDGLVELSWYLPGGKPEAILKREICFANLRGEAGIFKKQLNVLSKISSILCIVLPSACPDQTMQNILMRFVRNDTKVILLFNEKLEKSAKKYFDELKSNSDGKFSLITKAKRRNEYDYLQTIREGIRKKIDGVNARPLVKISMCANEYDIQLEDDQIDPEFKAMIDSLLEKGIERMKKLMTLQIHIPVLAELEREMYRPKRYGDKFIKEDNNEIYEKVAKSKEAQKTSLKHLDKDILNCLNHITMMGELERQKALNMLKHRLEIQRSNASLGLEHVIRELAQLYQI